MPQETYTCAVCNSTFDSKEALSEHMITAHATKTQVVEEGEQKT